jgi:hypothetical protein
MENHVLVNVQSLFARANGVGYDRNEEELWVRQKSLQDDPPLNINNYSACRQYETDLETILGVDTITVTV